MTALFAMTGKHPGGVSSNQQGPDTTQTQKDRLSELLYEMTASDVRKRPANSAEVLARLSRIETVATDKAAAGRAPTGKQTAGEKASGEAPLEGRVGKAGAVVEIVTRRSQDRVTVFNPDSSRPENMVLGALFDLWATKPWLLILIAAVLSAGPVAIALLIFFLHPKSKVLLNKGFAKTKDVDLVLDRREITVSDQLKPTEYHEIIDYEMRELPHPTGVQLETTLQMRNGKEHRFYLNSLSREEAREIMGIIDKRFRGG